jgi:two-component system, chemotaxis family, response regulator Rcp1
MVMNATLLTGAIQVLLVEDNPGDVRLTREALRDGKVCSTLSVVSDGVEALAFLRREGPYADACRPDLILLDLDLPRKDGREVLRELREDPALCDIRVVVVTGSEAELDISGAYALQADCFVTKPVGMDQLVTIVRSIQDFWFTIVRLPVDEPWYRRTDASIRIPLQDQPRIQAHGSES